MVSAIFAFLIGYLVAGGFNVLTMALVEKASQDDRE